MDLVPSPVLFFYFKIFFFFNFHHFHYIIKMIEKNAPRKKMLN